MPQHIASAPIEEGNIAGPLLVWLRRDLRLSDNPALFEAAKSGAIVPVYIHDEKAAGDWVPGGASRWWLHHSLGSLQTAFAKHGVALILRSGDSLSVLRDLARETGARAVYWNRRYEPWAIKQDTHIKETLKENGFTVHSFNGNLLCEPWEIRNGSGNPYKVFTPYWKACGEFIRAHRFHPPLPVPFLRTIDNKPHGDSLDAWKLLPTKPDWAHGLRDTWVPGEETAHNRFRHFLDTLIDVYKTQRDSPAVDGTSLLSPHLAFGEISPRQIVHAVRHAIDTGDIEGGALLHAETFVKEIGWREFAYHLLVNEPHTPLMPLNPKFNDFPWEHDPQGLRAWQKGLTGYPLVDAGMRQLWQTGWMHNRVRMIVGSFLVKNLLLPWQSGAHWFWDTLVDADLANNTLGWQWVGGCGADAAPFFRIFNPVTQSENFDPQGDYIRRFVPELKNVPEAYIHAPWKMPPLLQKECNLLIGKDYPAPIVDHGFARERALAALKKAR